MFGFHCTTTSGVSIRKDGYKDYVHMRVAVKKYLKKNNIHLASWYEFKVTEKGGFKIINKQLLTPVLP